MDRNLEAFEIINRLRGYRVVNLVGPEGIGKKSLAIFVATYVSDRDHFSNVVCVLNEKIKSLDHICQEMNELVRKDNSTLLVLDASKFANLEKAALTESLQNILKLSSIKMLIVSERDGAVEFPTSITVKKVELKPLTYQSTVTLFGALCPYVKERADTMVHTVHDFVNLVFRRKLFLEEREVHIAMPKRAAELFERLGAGYPKEIKRLAEGLSYDGYKAIIKLAKKYDVILKDFHTRRKLECAMLGAKLEMLEAQKDGLIPKAHSAWNRFQELDRQRESLPSVNELRQECEQVKAKLNETKIARDEAGDFNSSVYAELSKRANDLSKKLIMLKNRIALELEADDSEWVSCGAYGDHSDAAHDDDEVDDFIPPVGQIIDVDDSAVIPGPITHIAVRPLLTYRIKVKHPFVLQINHGPAQSFSYPSSKKAAIVVASNEACTGGQGILRAVTDAGGRALEQEVIKLPGARHSKFGAIRCFAGDARIVGPGSFGTLKVPYVMFAVGPWFTSENKEHRKVFLKSAYRSALKLAEEYKLEAVAFSLIGSSCRGGESWKETVEIGLNIIMQFHGYPELKEIHLFGFTSDEATELKEHSMEANAKFENIEQLVRRLEPTCRIHFSFSSTRGFSATFAKLVVQYAPSTVPLVLPLCIICMCMFCFALENLFA